MAWQVVEPSASAEGLVISGTQVVGEGAVEIGVVANIGLALYKVDAFPNWNTTIWVDETSKTTTGFTIKFGTPAPVDSKIDWKVNQ